MRYTVFNPLKDFYKNNSGKFYEKTMAAFVKIGFDEKIQELNDLGFKQLPDSTYGDHDMIIIDNKLKQWIWWENGFYPFCSYPNDANITDGQSLNHWDTYRS
jgi:hypothetical protein